MIPVFLLKLARQPLAWAALAVLALSGVSGYLKLRLDAVRGSAAVLEYRVNEATRANETNQATIQALKEANHAFEERIRLDAQAAEDAVARARAAAEALRAERDRARQDLGAALRSEPSCEALAELDLGTCPAFRDRLLGLYERSRQD